MPYKQEKLHNKPTQDKPQEIRDQRGDYYPSAEAPDQDNTLFEEFKILRELGEWLSGAPKRITECGRRTEYLEEGPEREEFMEDLKTELRTAFRNALNEIEKASLTPEEKLAILQDMGAEIESRCEKYNKAAGSAAEEAPLVLPKPGDKYPKYNLYIAEQSRNKIPVKDRMTGEEFLREHWGAYLEAGVLFLPDLRKLDMSLVNRLNYEGKKSGKSAGDYVPDIHEEIDRLMQDVDDQTIEYAHRVSGAAYRKQGKPRQTGSKAQPELTA